MREIDETSLQLLNGSRTGDRLRCWVWYDGELAWESPLPVDKWSLDWDATRQIQGVLKIDVTDSSGQLSPWLPDDILGVGGSQVQVEYHVGGGGMINMGWFRITSADPEDEWKAYLIPDYGARHPDSNIPPDTLLKSVPMGSIIPVDADDLTINVKNDRLLAPESPRGTSPTVLGEVERLLKDIIPVTVLEGVTDRSVPKSVIYERERLDAVEDLLARVDAAYRMNGNGEFEVYPLAPQPSVWTIRGGEQGALVRVKRTMKLDGLENMFVSDGTRKSKNSKGEDVDLPVRGIAKIGAGPLRDGGPHGRYTAFRSSPLITSQAIAIEDAQTFRDNQVKNQTIDLVVSCLPHPAIQTGDFVTVAHPVIDGRRLDLVGRVKNMKLSGANDTIDPMTLTVTCDANMVMMIMGGVDRGRLPIID